MQHPKCFPPFQPLAKSGPGHVPLKDFPIKEQVKVILADAPWSSVENLEAFLGESGLAAVCGELEEEGFIAGLDVVVNRLSTRRFVLSRRGVRHVTRPFHYDGQVRPALPLTWQMTEDGVLRLLSWLPMIEAFYEVLPTFWTGGLATPFEQRSEYPELGCDSYLWLGIPALTDLRWFSRGRLHVSATWRFYRPDQPDRYMSVPFFWSGLLPQEDFNDRSLRLGSPFIRSLHSPGDYLWEGLAPVVIAVGVDEFSAWRARWAYGADVKVASLDPAGSLVWSAEASESEWTLEDTRPAARVIGYPENAVGAQSVEVLNFGGIREHRLFHFIAQFRSATRANLVKAFHMSRGAVREVLELLRGRGLVMEVDGHLYVTQAGLQMLAARDRIEIGRLVEVTYEDPEGEAAVRERIHDAAVAEAAAHFLAKGLMVVAGWRWLVSWGEGKDEGQLVPDLWVQIPGPRGGTWVPVEVEFSATTKKRVEEKKLRSYRLALEERHTDYPIIVITGEEPAVKVFDDAAGGLTIFATALKRFRTDVWEGPQSVWQHRSEPVALNDIAAESRVHLWQNTGLKVETSPPPVDIWVAMHRREYIWEDPMAEGWERWQWDGLREDKSGEETGPAGGGPTIPLSPPSAVRPAASGSKPVAKPVPVPVPTAPRQPAAPVAARPPAVPGGGGPMADARLMEHIFWDFLRERRPVLARINVAVEDAYAVAERRVHRDKRMSALERLCLERLMAIVAYGAAVHENLDDAKVQVIVGMCLRLEDEHMETKMSIGALKLLTAPESHLNPRRAFRDLVKEFPTHGPEGRKLFGRWSKLAGRAVGAARKGRTLQSSAE